MSGRPTAAVLVSEEDQLPELLIRGGGLRTAQLNAENPVGTIQSVEHALRALDKNLADETERRARAEKMLADYREQLGRPFEHEARLKELVAKQTELNAALDLDKGEQQAAAPAEGNAEVDTDERSGPENGPASEPRPRPIWRARTRREYGAPVVVDAAEDEEVVQKAPGPKIGQRP